MSLFLDFRLEEASTEIISFQKESRPSAMSIENGASGCFGGSVHSISPPLAPESNWQRFLSEMSWGTSCTQAVHLWVLGDRQHLPTQDCGDRQFLVVQPQGNLSSLIAPSAASA